MRKTIANRFAPDLDLPSEDDVEDRRRDLTSRPPTLGRRRSARRRVLLSGLIVDLAKELIVSCRVENVSVSGARIRLAQPCFLPPSFWFIAVTSGLAYSAKIVWRDEELLGVEVGESIDLTDPADLVGRRLQRMWKARR